MEKRLATKNLILVLMVVSTFGSVSCVDDKCAACSAVAAELETGLSNEKPRNHLDMRHRLDSKGQREGKVIDYRVSELRAVELLDDLCDKMQDYTLQKVSTSRHEWVKVPSWDNLKAGDKQEAKAHAKDISTYCGRLLEETEDEFAGLIRKGSVQPGDVMKVLCEDLSKHCSQSRTDGLIDVVSDKDL
ncbi:hypothetical protein H6P81_015759 [Aristolochia fimbriata]|uniref:DUF3456 domain-containing protein n=1 Tax=Aristolochia fimbriata TaxID=158543 RepID=A0AAV7E746_ARIFI|nr:hypothetical protein H6P81_015759 [Aristolochia fimbriata]